MLRQLVMRTPEVDINVPYGTVRFSDSRLEDTPYGQVVVYQGYRRGDYAPISYTVVPGFFLQELEPVHGHRKIDVNLVPEEQQRNITEILKSRGYLEPIKFWRH